MQKLNVGFVFGGDSAEREVSIVTMLQIKRIAEVSAWMIPHYFFLDPNRKDIFYLEGSDLIADNFKAEGYKKVGKCVEFKFGGDVIKAGGVIRKKLAHVDAIINCCHGGYGESGELAGFMKMLSIPFSTPNALGMGLSMDKHLFKCVMRASRVQVPSWVCFSKAEFEDDNIWTKIQEKIKRLGESVIVKPNASGSSLGITVVKAGNDLCSALQVAFEFDSKVIVEKLVPNVVEFNCVCVSVNGETKVTDIDQIESKGDMFTFDQKYIGEGGKSTQKAGAKKMAGMAGAKRLLPAPISEELTQKIKQIAMKVFDTLGLVAPARVDFLYDKENDKLYVGEVNAVPGSMGLYFFERTKFDGLTLIHEMVKSAIESNKQIMSVRDEFVPKIIRK